MLFIGFKHKLNMTTQLGHRNLIHLPYLAQYYKPSTRSYLGCTALENYQTERIQVNSQSC